MDDLAEHIASTVGDETAAAEMVRRLQIQEVCEEDIRQRAVQRLAALCTGTSPEDALESLWWWVYTAAENRTVLGKEAVREKITQVGASLAERDAYAREWFRTIRPLPGGMSPCDQPEALAKEYASGVAARFEHIVAGLDVRRDSLLARVHDCVTRHSVTVLHGASGQGKSSLGYRYAHDFLPEKWRFYVDLIENSTHARNIALALVGHAKATASRTLVLVDVVPGNMAWVELARSLANHPSLKLLVMAREEDWRRSFSQIGDLTHGDIELTLEEDEARSIYDSIREVYGVSHFLSFQDAWDSFGARGALLEFAYFLHNNRTLEDRLAAQIAFLRDAVRGGSTQSQEVDFLRLVSVATECGVSVDLRGLATITGVREPKRVAELFEKEYLLRLSEGGTHAVALHPIRSGILARLLTDDTFSPWAEAMARVLPAVREEDLQWFLLSAFHRRPASSVSLLAALGDLQPKSWTGLRGCMRAVLWLGVRDYVDENRAVIHEAFSQCGTSWRVMLPFDVAGISDMSPAGMFASLGSADAAKVAAEFENRMTSGDHIFRHYRTLMQSNGLGLHCPASTEDWRALGEVCFWLGHLATDSPVRNAVSERVLADLFAEEDIEAVGLACLGIATLWGERYREWYSSHEEELKERVRRSIRAVSLVGKEETLTAVFLLSNEELALLGQGDNSNSRQTVSLNSLVMDRLYVIRNIIPFWSKYGCSGIGHRMPLVDLPYDESVKSGVLRENMLPRWGPELNSIFPQLAELELRPPSWEAFVEEVLRIRNETLEVCTSLQNGILAHYSEESNTNIFAEHVSGERWDQLAHDCYRIAFFPQCGVDVWGLGERKDTDPSLLPSLQYSGTRQRRAKGYEEVAREYARTLGNFLKQAVRTVVRNTALGKAQNPLERSRIEALLVASGFPGEGQHLTMVNLADFCKSIPQFIREAECFLAEQLPQNRHAQLSHRELREIPRLCLLWNEFLERPEYVRRGDARRKRLGRLQQLDPETEMKQIRGHLRSVLQRASGPGISFRIYDTEARWESEPTLWIVCDAADPSRLFDASRVAEKCLHRALNTCRSNAAHRFLVDFYWPRIVLVPLLLGKSLRRMAYPELRGAVCLPQSELGEQWKHLPIIVDNNTWEKTGLQQWILPQIIKIQRFYDALAEFYSQCSHHVDFMRAEKEMDDLGGIIAQEYIENTQEMMSASLQHVFDQLVWLLEYCNEIDEVELLRRTSVAEALKLLVDVGNALKPPSNETGTTCMKLGDLSEWHSHLGEVLGLATIAEILWSADALGIPCDAETLGRVIATLGS